MKKSKQFCIHEHDTWICGRYKNSQCKICAKLTSEERVNIGCIRFCIRGHNKDITGEYSDGSCAVCRRMLNKQKYVKKIRSSICKNGHDKDIMGRRGRGCAECARIADRKTRKICPNGHDTSVTGRYKNGICIECSKLPSEQFCVHGHDTFVSGRDKKGHCKVCVRLYRRRHERILRKIDFNFRIAKTLRGRLKAALRENWKTGSAVRDLGCSIDFLVAYLQDKFYGKMTWDNWGIYWEIDHIKELVDFDLSKRSQLLKAVHYTNLRPLTKPDHWKKSAQAKRDRKNKS